VLSDDQRPNPLKTGCPAATSDSNDPLAQFLSERADAPSETAPAPRSAKGDPSLLAFASETGVTNAPIVSDASGHRPAFRRVVPTTVLTSSCSRVVGITRSSLLRSRGALRPSRAAADRLRAYFLPRFPSFAFRFTRLVIRAAVWALAFCRTLCEGGRQQFVPLTGGRARARRLRRIAAMHGAARQGRSAQSHRWTYPAGLFLSGAAAGAFLVTIARIPVENDVAAQVAAQPAARIAAANYMVAERPAPPAPIVPSVASTSGVTANARQQAARQAPVAVSASRARTDRPSFVGSISINSSPQGAVVFLNGQRVGTTPLVMPDLPVGSRAVRLTMPGYSTWSRAVQVVADRRTTLSATLEEAPQ